MLSFVFNPGDGVVVGDALPAGVAIVVLPDGNVRVTVDPLVAHNLQGSKRQLAALRAQLAQERKPWDADRQRMTDTLMKVTFALSSFLEAYDWLMASPQSGLTDDGRARIQGYFLGVLSGARAVLADARTVNVDWDEVVGGRKVDGVTGEGIERPVWATIAAELQPMVNGPEGAALVRFLEHFALEEPELRFNSPTDWLHWVYSSTVRGLAACRAIMETDPDRREFATKLYQGLVSVSLNLARALAIRGLALVPEPDLVKRDPYVACHDCLAPAKCEAERRCARGGERKE